MRLISGGGYLILICGLVIGGALLTSSVLQSPLPDSPRETGARRVASAAPRSSIVTEPSEASASVIPRQPIAAAALQAPAAAAEDYPAEWDALDSAERVTHLESRFTSAVEVIEAEGVQRKELVFIAQSALTSLRGELYGSKSGRERYLAHESRLDRALGEPAGVHKGARSE